MKPAIHIITPETGTLARKYVIDLLANHWRAWGHQVSRGLLPSLNSGIGLVHINRTVINPAHLPAVSARTPLLNGKALDISKNSFSTLQLAPDDRWDGPVIVKSNLNFFGNPERSEIFAGTLGKLDRAVSRLLSAHWQLARRLPHNDYPILPSIANVPGWVWKRDDLIVERFLPERVGDFYSIRGWLFFGQRGYAYRLYATSPVVKAGNISHFGRLDCVPEELQALRRQYAFDFGKFDYVEIDGKAVLLDINKTPTTVALQDSPRLRDLAEGIQDFMDLGQ